MRVARDDALQEPRLGAEYASEPVKMACNCAQGGSTYARIRQVDDNEFLPATVTRDTDRRPVLRDR